MPKASKSDTFLLAYLLAVEIVVALFLLNTPYGTAGPYIWELELYLAIVKVFGSYRVFLNVCILLSLFISFLFFFFCVGKMIKPLEEADWFLIKKRHLILL
ncbi:MAG: hypothetical protein QXJ02_02700, partial [Candidatus Bathyarchaeia archaeon]